MSAIIAHRTESYNHVRDPDRVLFDDTRHSLGRRQADEGAAADLPSFEPGGPRELIYFDPGKTRVGIVTCGGLCPGLNDVIRGLVEGMSRHYGVRRIYGFTYGYQGFIPRYNRPVLDLTHEFVSDINEHGGTILGSSRGKQDPVEIVDCLERMSISILFVVGGDGTLRGAHAIHEEAAARGARVSVVGIPKTIDNDICFIDQSFGFQTAFSEATRHIRAAHIEATGAPNGVGLVKLMGRHSGFIACYASLAMSDVNFVLIPEVPFALEGEGGFLQHLKRRIERRGHAVIVAAEGAGQDLLATTDATTDATDASGNKRLHDIGPYLRDRINAFFAAEKIELNLKYIDPSYSIRSVPANPYDSVYCFRLALNAVHAAMAGRTDCVVGRWHGRFVHIPIPLVIRDRNTVDPNGDLWLSVLESTGQPRMFGQVASVGH